MILKCPIRRLCKRLKLSPEVITATVRDEYRELGYENQQARVVSMPRRLSERPMAELSSGDVTQEQAPIEHGAHEAAKSNGGQFPAQIVELQKLLVLIAAADASLTADVICSKYFKTKDQTFNYDAVKAWRKEKSLNWVHSQCKKIREDYKTILPPPEPLEAEGQETLPL
jgi:transposase